MEGMVIEVYDKSVIVMTPEGTFLEVPHTKKVSIGDRIPIHQIRELKPKQTVLKRFVPLAASFLLVAVLGLAGYGYSNVFGYVTVDINPSTVISYNWFHRTVDVEALNEDATLILMKMGSLKNKSLQETVQAIVDTSEKEGFLGEDGSHQVLITASDKSSSHRSLSILKEVNETVALPEDVDYVVVNGNAKSYYYIKGKGISPVLMILEDTLETEDSEALIIQSTKSVQEILKEEKKEQQEQKAIEKQEQKEEHQEQIQQKQEEKQQQIEEKKEEQQQQIENKKEEKENPGQGNENSNNSNGASSNNNDEEKVTPANTDPASSSDENVNTDSGKGNNKDKEKNTPSNKEDNEQSNNGDSSNKSNDQKNANQGGNSNN